MNPPTAGQGRRGPAALAAEHGLSAQAVRNYERDGVLPPAARTASGYRVYGPAHAAALRAYLALVRGHGYAAAGEVMRAVHRGDVPAALRLVDESHVRLHRDRATIDAVATAAGALAAGRTTSARHGDDRPVTVGRLAGRLGISPATLRTWERSGVLRPGRDPATGRRLYRPDDVRDAELAHLLRRGGLPVPRVATVVRETRDAGGTAAVAASLGEWQEGLTARARAMLTAAALLDAYLRVLEAEPRSEDRA